jgi:hypothetical protein
MQNDERYEDLTALFEAQDEGLQKEVFVKNVMKPIRRRSRWRTPILFGAGGVGLGAALSEIGGLWTYLRAQTPTQFEADFSVSLNALPTANVALDMTSIWAIAVVFMVMTCAVLVMTERA